jgi:23S rRNA (cytosine1962-C5)-methyltransferase
VLGRGSPPETLARFVQDAVLRADRVRTRLLDPRTDAYRVVSGAGDGLPGVVVDRYGGVAVLKLYSAGWAEHLELLSRAVGSLGWVRTVARRLGVANVDASKGLVVLSGAAVPDAIVVQEGDIRLLARLEVGQKTGLFLDQRAHRAMIRGWARGRTVANLFSYNGGFSVAAALGGAARVHSVDIAPDAIEDAKEIFRLNHIDPDDHAFEVADVFAWKPAQRFDLLIVDPPSLARAKRSVGAARSAYRKLHRGLSPHVPRDGLLATSSCTARLSHEEWQGAVLEGLADADWSWHWTSGHAVDHPTGLAHSEARYLKFALLRKR